MTEKLIAKFENDSISFETDVRVIDAGSMGIEVFYTRSEYIGCLYPERDKKAPYNRARQATGSPKQKRRLINV